MWEKKHKREIVSASKAIDKDDQNKIQNAIESPEQEAARIVAAIMSPRKEPQNGKDRKDPQDFQSKEPLNVQEEEQAYTLKDIELPKT